MSGKKIKDVDVYENVMYGNIVDGARRRFENFSPELKKYFFESLDKILNFDKNRQITMLSYFFRKSIGDDGKSIDDEIVTELGIANVFIWMAYTIYDDFLDDEGDPKMLSVANVCLREFAVIYEKQVRDNQAFRKVFNQVMNTLDSANAREVTHCRALVSGNIFYVPETIPEYGDFSKLAERSLAHALGPIAILHILGLEGDNEASSLLNFFKHYLIARQLNDDAHDWEEDLKKGHIDSIVSEILKKVNTKTIDIENDIKKIQKDFWFGMVVEVSKKVLENIDKSKESLRKVLAVKDNRLLEQFLDSTENAAKIAIKEQGQAMDFLKAYK